MLIYFRSVPHLLFMLCAIVNIFFAFIYPVIVLIFSIIFPAAAAIFIQLSVRPARLAKDFHWVFTLPISVMFAIPFIISIIVLITRATS